MKRFLEVIVFASVLLTTAAAAAQESARPTGNTLASLVAELEMRNPALAAERRELDMSLARIRPAGAPQDPVVSAGYMSGFARPPFFPGASTPNAFRQFSITQELPYPGKLPVRSRIAASAAEAARWSVEDSRLGLVAELKTMYFEYQLASRSLEIVRRNREVLDQFRQIAETRFSVGQAIQQDVLKAQLEISGLIERTAVLERQRDTLRARINALLYRDADAPLNPDLEFSVTPPADAAALRAEAARRYPALKRDEQRITAAEQQVSLARKEFRPDFGVNFTVQQPVAGMPWMYGVDLMVRVPIFWQRKQRPMLAEAAAGLEAERRRRESTLASAEARVSELNVAAASARRLIDLYEGSVLPQARLTLESALASYQVGKAEFLTVLTGFSSVLTYEIGLEEQRTQYRAALAGLEPLVSGQFIK